MGQRAPSWNASALSHIRSLDTCRPNVSVMAIISLAMSTAAIASRRAEPQVRKKPHVAQKVEPDTQHEEARQTPKGR